MTALGLNPMFGSGKTRPMISDYGDYPPDEKLEGVLFSGVRKKRGQWYVGVKEVWVIDRHFASFVYVTLKRCKRKWLPVEAHTASEATKVGQSMIGLMA